MILEEAQTRWLAALHETTLDPNNDEVWAALDEAKSAWENAWLDDLIADPA